MHPTESHPLFQEELYQFTSDVLIVLPHPWDQYKTEQQSLLGKILTSVKVDINSVQIVVQPQVDLGSLASFSPHRVLIFGAGVADPMESYQCLAARGFTVIRADDLPALDDHKKKNLWTALRQMFGV